MANIAANVAELIGHTPLVRINRLFPGAQATVLAKLEYFNPASSVKDRVALSIIEAAEASGDLKPGGTIVEATSGNTGIGLALVGAARGYRVIITMPESMSRERRVLMSLLGADLVLTPATEGVKGCVRKSRELAAQIDGAILADQFNNPANVAAHYRTTAEEIWADTGGQLAALVAGTGTGGTISGAGRRLKELDPAIRVIGAEPAESPMLTQGTAGPHKIQGWGPNFVPGNIDRGIIDEILLVPGDEAIMVARQAARHEGILTGISGGGALHAAGQLAFREEFAGATIVAIVADTAERYLSTALVEGLGE